MNSISAYLQSTQNWENRQIKKDRDRKIREHRFLERNPYIQEAAFSNHLIPFKQKKNYWKKKLLRFSILSLNDSDFIYHHLKTWLSPADRFITEGVWQKSLYCLCAQLLLGAYPSRLKSLRNKFDDDSLPISLVPESLEKIVFVEGNEGRFLDWGNGPKLPTSYIHIKVFYFFSISDMQHEMLPVLHRFFWQFQKKSS